MMDCISSLLLIFSTRVCVYILKIESDTFERFNKWYTLIENQLKIKLNVLKIQNDPNFVSE